MKKIELLKELYESVDLFPYTLKLEETIKVSIEVDGNFSKHIFFEGKWQLINKLWSAKEYVSFHISKDIFNKLNNKVIASNLWLDVDAKDIVESTKQLMEILEILQRDLKMERDKDFYLKYSGNKGYHILIPHWKFPNKEVYSSLVKILKAKLSKYDIDWQLLDSSHHLIRDFWAYNPKGDKISLYVPKEYKLSEIVTNYSRLDKENIKAWLEIDELLKNNINYDKLNEDAINKIKELESHIRILERMKLFDPNKYKKPTFEGNNKIKKFPKKVREILERGIQKDGRERFLFLLATICKANNMTYKEFEQLVKQWNEKNYRVDERDWERWLKTLKYQMEWYEKNWNNFKYKIPSKKGKGWRYWEVD